MNQKETKLINYLKSHPGWHNSHDLAYRMNMTIASITRCVFAHPCIECERVKQGPRTKRYIAYRYAPEAAE